MLMALIAAACLAGTLVVQSSDDPHEAIARYYGSWWFIGLLGLLVLSTAACAFSGLRLTLRKFYMLLVHGSILLIAAGAIVSEVARAEGQLIVREGRIEGQFGSEASTRFHTHGPRGDEFVPLGFLLRLDKFTIQYTDSADGPIPPRMLGSALEMPSKIKNFESRVTVLDDTGHEIRNGVIRVNSPFTFGRFTFYQQDYYFDEDRGTYSVFLVKSDPGVPLVFGGFVLLPIGIALAIYAKPRLARKGPGDV